MAPLPLVFIVILVMVNAEATFYTAKDLTFVYFFLIREQIDSFSSHLVVLPLSSVYLSLNEVV